jgi:hypothetical protein
MTLLDEPAYELEFEVTFHSRFRVGAAYPRDGLDVVFDPAEPLPAEHLKGLMRYEARSLLADTGDAGTELIAATFGEPGGQESPWHWTSAEPLDPQGWSADIRHRVKINPITHAAERDHLVAASAAYTQAARFRVCLMASADQPKVQAALLRLSARSIHHLGAWRRRGLGWVGVHVVGDEDDGVADDVRADLATVQEFVKGLPSVAV